MITHNSECFKWFEFLDKCSSGLTWMILVQVAAY